MLVESREKEARVFTLVRVHYSAKLYDLDSRNAPGVIGLQFSLAGGATDHACINEQKTKITELALLRSKLILNQRSMYCAQLHIPSTNLSTLVRIQQNFLN